MITIHCRRCLQARQVASSRGLDTRHCESCRQEYGALEVGWCYPDELPALEAAREIAAELLIDDLLRAALQHFEIRVPYCDHELRGALACVYEQLDEDGRL